VIETFAAAWRKRLSLLEQPDTETWLATIFGQQQLQTKTILGKKLASMRPRLRFILMVLQISVFFGMVVSIASFAAMMLGIGMPLGFSVAGVFMLFSSRLGRYCFPVSRCPRQFLSPGSRQWRSLVFW
jgi:hypothetical protein